MKKKKHVLLTAVIVLFVLVALFFTTVNYIADFLWFQEVGYTSVPL